jgi:hypothetical protein
VTVDEHVELAERLLESIPVEQVHRRQGLDPRHVHTATLAQAHATLAVAKKQEQ